MGLKTGTFSATGQSEAVELESAVVTLTITGSATVALECQVDGTNWRVIESFTANTVKVVDFAGVYAKVRLNCTAVSGSAAYAIKS